MRITRRTLVRASSAALALPAIARHAFAEEAIRVGWLATFTGPLSSPTIGFDRGVKYAVEQINAKGGGERANDRGRLARHAGRSDQGGERHPGRDQPAEVHAIFGPVNSGELLATTPIMARAKMPSLVAVWSTA